MRGIPASAKTGTPPSLTKRAQTNVERQPLPTDAQLQQLSDSASFKRAQSYVHTGAVEITARLDRQIDAIVSGTEDYSVRLLLGGREAESHCTCPAFAKGIFCKHLIATAIVARDHATTEDGAGTDSADAPQGYGHGGFRSARLSRRTARRKTCRLARGSRRSRSGHRATSACLPVTAFTTGAAQGARQVAACAAISGLARLAQVCP